MDAEQLLSLLKLTDNKTPFESLSYSTQNNVDHQSIVGAMKSLQVSGGENFISADLQQTKEYTLSDEANDVLNKGSFEYRLLEQIVAAGESGIAQPELMKANAKIAKVGFANCLKNRWIKMDKATKNVTALVDMSVKDTLRDNLNNVANLDDKTRNDLKKRKLITELAGVEQFLGFKIFRKNRDFARQKANFSITSLSIHQKVVQNFTRLGF